LFNGFRFFRPGGLVTVFHGLVFHFVEGFFGVVFFAEAVYVAGNYIFRL
jgi:hypothetical protein